MQKIHLSDFVRNGIASRNDNPLDRDPEFQSLLNSFRTIATPRPYRTTLWRGAGVKGASLIRRYVFSTTSKGAHLMLGRLSYDDQVALCELLEQRYEATDDPEIAFSFEPASGERLERTLFVIRTFSVTSEEPCVTFHLSPGH